MKSRVVIFSKTARIDLLDIYEWIAESVSWETASRYITRVEQFCMSLDLASERGARRDDLRPGLRVIGFEKSISIIFEVTDDSVNILRLFRAGRDWEAELAED